MKKLKLPIIVLLALCVTLSFATAHSGRTDSNGGHKDNKNKSGLGSYHYHHGYEAHLHPGGVCPYNSTEPTQPAASPAPAAPTQAPPPEPVVTPQPKPPADIKIMLNGELIALTDVNGNTVKPTVIDGTTYLPIRGLASALDLGVEWNGDTNTINLTSKIDSMGGAVSESVQQQAAPDYTGIKITMNGKTVTPTDANGKVVEPFAISGTTYLPVRGIASALGLGVTWDEATQTVALTSGTPVAQTNKFAQFEDGLKAAGYTYEKVDMAASMVGAISGVKYKFSDGKVELYEFDVDSVAYKAAVSSGKLNVDGFGSFSATVKNGMAAIIDAGDKNDTILKIFDNIK